MTGWGRVAWTVLLLALGTVPARGEDDRRVAIEELVATRKYREAYDKAAGAKGRQQEALGELARVVLLGSMRSSDSYERWFALRALQPLEDQMLVDGARVLAGSDDRYERSLAVEYLARTDPGACRKDLLGALGSPFRSVRVRALGGLSSLRDPALVSRFSEVAERDEDPDVRALAIQALRDTGSPEALAPIRRALGDPMPLVQREAVRALVALRDGRVIEMVRALLARTAREERLRAIDLAGLVADRTLVGDLGALLADGDAEVRTAAAGALLSVLEGAAAEEQR